MKIFKKALAYYRQLKKEEHDRKMLITHNTDWALLEKLIQKSNENPDLKIEIVLASGDVIKMKTTANTEIKTPQFDGVYVVN